MQNKYTVLARRARITVWFSYVALLVVFTLVTVVAPSCNRDPNPVIWCIHLLLLLPFLPAIIKQDVRGHAWLTFVLLGFFMASVSTAFACTSWLTLLEVSLISSLFIAALLFIRWRSRELKADIAASAVDFEESQNAD
ncbi:DUF2069 domain-containing protein [Oceanicoccus sp. KOV_DT_Chl]|uniref:DUF2069 domain-containing protein n=1 Tax=Oceanicoccus sp. KOV_DT_Chl TaxID=1904639 RepID=UPI000C7C3AB7|nr:DUF2069 domain-containing protein [Oceanicoccus sp. KOV_DT_Chl]